MCGIVGITSNASNACLSINNALTVIQHRGQDAAGMAVVDNSGFLSTHKSTGLVRDVFKEDEMMRLKGTSGIGHVRYPTAGAINTSEAQPFYVNSPHGIVLVHNGNLVINGYLDTSEGKKLDYYYDVKVEVVQKKGKYSDEQISLIKTLGDEVSNKKYLLSKLNNEHSIDISYGTLLKMLKK